MCFLNLLSQFAFPICFTTLLSSFVFLRTAPWSHGVLLLDEFLKVLIPSLGRAGVSPTYALRPGRVSRTRRVTLYACYAMFEVGGCCSVDIGFLTSRRLRAACTHPTPQLRFRRLVKLGCILGDFARFGHAHSHLAVFSFIRAQCNLTLAALPSKATSAYSSKLCVCGRGLKL